MSAARSFHLVSSANAGTKQRVIIPAGSRPTLISVLAGPSATRFSINRDTVDVDPEVAFNLDKNALPECIGEQWEIIFDDQPVGYENPVRWAVAWEGAPR